MRFLAALCLCFGLVASAFAADIQRIHLGENTGLELVGQTENSLTFEASVGELVGFQVATTAGQFTSLSIPGYHEAHIEGSPAVPMMNQLCEMPLGASVRIETEATETHFVQLADFGLTDPLLPAQPSLAKNLDPAGVPFIWNRTAYAAGSSSRPDLVAVTDVGQMRAVRIGRVEVAPVRYDPVANTIEVYTRLRFTVHFEGGDRAAAEQLKIDSYSPFFEPVYQFLAGYRTPHTDHPDLMVGRVTYLIVADRSFENELQPFIQWKIRQGFKVIAGYTDTIGSTTTAIRNYLQNLYNTLNPRPTFVLFVGDINYIPCYYSSGATDLTYCDYTSDNIPEMYYGRFSARNLADLTPQISKTLEYEQATFPDPSYLAEVVMIAGVDGSYGPTYANGQINYGTRHYFNTAHGLTPYVYLYPQSGSSRTQIIANVSGGVAFANYTAHGDIGGWSNPSFTNNDINTLNNEHMYCVAIGNCCLTSSFDSQDCFAEHWLRADRKGAVGYIGGSNYTYWDEDYWWGVGNKQVVPSGADYDASRLGMYDGLWHTHGENMSQWYVVQDAFIFCGNLAVVQGGGSMVSYYWRIYNLMGDPSLSPYVGIPTVNAVSYPEYIDPQDGVWPVSVPITATPNSYVGFTKNGVLVGSGLIGDSGNGMIQVIGHGTSGELEMVVTCQNKFPFSVIIPISNPASVADNGALRLVLRSTPNPSASQAHISLDLGTPQTVDLKIHDVSGRIIRTLAAGPFGAGQHVFDWDGRDGAGVALPSGVYLARLRTDNGSERSWKLVLGD